MYRNSKEHKKPLFHKYYFYFYYFLPAEEEEVVGAVEVKCYFFHSVFHDASPNFISYIKNKINDYLCNFLMPHILKSTLIIVLNIPRSETHTHIVMN